MNIDEYRALKQAEESGTGEQVDQTATAVLEENQQETPEVQLSPEPQGVQETPQPEQGINYQEELEKLRQEKDELAKQARDAEIAKQYYDKLMADPEYAKVFAQNNGLEFVDPKEMEFRQLEQKYNDLLLERDIENMKIKYQDFNPNEVIKFAVDRQINKLEDAYLLHKAHQNKDIATQTMDVSSLAEQIRQQVLNELQSNVNTGSMIGQSGGGAKPVQTAAPELSPQEAKVARGLNMSPAEYAKWKTIK